MPASGWRVVLITSVAPLAQYLVATVRELGHEPVAILAPRRKQPPTGDLAMTDASVPSGVDIVHLRGKSSLLPLLRAYAPDVVLCWGFPWLIPDEALAVPRLGAVNMHPALLPRHRGPIPTAWAVRSGDSVYGITWHRMEGAFDTGPILAQTSVPADPDDADMMVVGPRLGEAALRLLPEVFRRLEARDPGDPQIVTGDEPYAAFFGEDYAEIDWSKPARYIHDQVRAWSLGGIWHGVVGPVTELDGARVRITRTSRTDPGEGGRRIECGDGPLWLVAWESLEGSAGGSAQEAGEPAAEESTADVTRAGA